jgi:hypothetical protein
LRDHLYAVDHQCRCGQIGGDVGTGATQTLHSGDADDESDEEKRLYPFSFDPSGYARRYLLVLAAVMRCASIGFVPTQFVVLRHLLSGEYGNSRQMIL